MKIGRSVRYRFSEIIAFEEAKLRAVDERRREMISRRALFAALTDRHFGNGSPTWRVGRGKSWERPCDTFADAESQRDQLVTKLAWLGKHHNLPVAQQLARKLRRCRASKPCRSGACPVCVRALQRLCVEVGIEIGPKGAAATMRSFSAAPDFGQVPAGHLSTFHYPAFKAQMESVLAASGVDWYFLALDVSLNHVKGNSAERPLAAALSGA